MADIVKMFGDGSDGWNLTQKQAQQLYIAEQIAEPTLKALKNYFLNKVLIPKLEEIAVERGLQKPSSRDISKLREEVPEISVEGKGHDLISLNKLWTAMQKSKTSGKPLGNASSFLRDAYRTRAGKGFDKLSLRQADFYDNIDNLRAIRDRDLANASGPDEEKRVYSQYDNAMVRLFRKNRKWLPKKDNQLIKYSPTEDREGKYGWQPGKDREGFLQYQTSVYDLSQDQSRWLAQKLGIKQDAGHTVPLGGMIISDAERQKYFIDKSELEPNPDGEGWILRGTNSLTNLAIEDAKANRAKGNEIAFGRQLRDIIEMDVAFTKTRSLAEYNLGDDTSFRKLPDFSTALQTLFAHSGRDINELKSIGENQTLQTGIQEAPTLPKNQFKNQKGLIPAWQDPRKETEAGPLTTETYSTDGTAFGGLLSRTVEPSNFPINNQELAINNEEQFSNQLDSSAPAVGGANRLDIVEYKEQDVPRGLNQELVNGNLETIYNDPNELQKNIDFARGIAVEGFHWSANKATGGTYNQWRNYYNAAQNLKNQNWVGLTGNVLQGEFSYNEKIEPIWSNADLLNPSDLGK